MNKTLLILITYISLSQANIINLLNSKNIFKISSISSLIGMITFIRANNSLKLTFKQWQKINGKYRPRV